MVAILVELLDTLHRRDEEMLMVLESPRCLYSELVDFTEEFHNTLYYTDDTWYHRNNSSFTDPLTSLSQALAAYKSTPWTTWFNVKIAASEWQEAVSLLVDSWARLPRKATKLHNACREVAAEVADRAAPATAPARELQDEAAHYGTAQENMVELGQALGREEGDEVVAGHEAKVREEAIVAASKARRATMANNRLANDHLEETLDYIIKFYVDGEPVSPSAFGVAERCQRAIEDIPRLLQPRERPQGVPNVSPVSMECQEV
ncbi:uncharacterized protein LOC128945546 [Melozone crissalis]|uniref:uncharacterized protein LOC128945546 n=1 Tax=Melozone crissalis TaxID=40204 RepID=UPI0023DC1DFE|nr:uncharacterized protein LOC128945546 [Melozone crissalis]